MTATPYDPTLKDLVELEPEVWPAVLGGPVGPTAVIDAEISTVTGAADKVLRVAAEPPYLLHLEFVSGHDVVALPPKLVLRNTLLADRHRLLVRSGVVLLHREANSPQLTGLYERNFPGEEPYLIFRYQVMRVWQLPPEPFLTGGVALLPLALVSNVTTADLPGIIQRIQLRLVDRGELAGKIWAAAYVLLGLCQPAALVAQLFQGVRSMKESSTYQAILAEGRAEGQNMGAVAEARKLLRKMGTGFLGQPDEQTSAAIERIADLTRLEELCERLPSVKSWQELLG